MTREEAHNLTERLADAVARYAKSQHGQAQTDYQAQADAYNAQNEIIAALAPAPAADDVALVDDFLSAHRSVWANTGDDAERYEYRKEADAARAALLARFAAIRRETIEACARVADTDSGQGYDPYEAAERIAKNIRALAGKEK